jgi:PII-like signaling protein
MSQERAGVLLRIYLGEQDTFQGRPLYEQIVREARRLHLAGATVLRGILGFGATSRLHSAKLLRLSEDLPLVVEIVDTAERIDTLMPFLEAHLRDGLVTTENVRLLSFGSEANSPTS